MRNTFCPATKKKKPERVTGVASYPHVDDAVDGRFASVDLLFFVFGAQTAGTTWLSHYFKPHPNVSVPEWKEYGYWNMAKGRPHAPCMLRVQAERRNTESVLCKLVARLPSESLKSEALC